MHGANTIFLELDQISSQPLGPSSPETTRRGPLFPGIQDLLISVVFGFISRGPCANPRLIYRRTTYVCRKYLSCSSCMCLIEILHLRGQKRQQVWVFCSKSFISMLEGWGGLSKSGLPLALDNLRHISGSKTPVSDS